MSTDPRPVIPDCLPLPPTPRDFDIHKMHLVYFASTRTIAQKHGISQTRVRQIVQRVSRWLAASLPVKTEAELEQETRLAQNLAADQLRNQLEDLRILWDATHDPKYSRQQTRVITALARLGILPGAIDTLAADVTAGPLDPHEPQAPWSEDDPWANSGSRHTPCAVAPQPETCNLKPETQNLQPETSAPPPGACSPSPPSPSLQISPSPTLASANPSATKASVDHRAVSQDAMDGLKLLEERLLTLLDNTNETDAERRASLSRTLQQVRGEQANLQIRLAPYLRPRAVPLGPSPPGNGAGVSLGCEFPKAESTLGEKTPLM